MARVFYDTLGEVAGYALANDDLVTQTIRDTDANGQPIEGLTIAHKRSAIDVYASPSDAYLTAVLTDRISSWVKQNLAPQEVHTYAEEHNISPEEAHSDLLRHRLQQAQSNGADQRPIEVIQDIAPDFGADIYPLWFDHEQQDLFDGVRVEKRLYAFEDEFSLSDYARTVDDLVTVLNKVSATLDNVIDVDLHEESAPDVEAADRSEATASSDHRYFQ